MNSDEQSMEEQHDLTRAGHQQAKQPFGNYDLIRRIDMGGMGEVYLAQQRSAFNREVAIKIIRDDLSRDLLARARFFREAEVSSHLKHDHILPLFEFGEVQGRLFLVTPYIAGGTLAQSLEAGPLSVVETQQLFTALALAVAYIHRRGVVHRDLKPSNILLDHEELTEQIYVRLIDFGIATKHGDEASAPLTPSNHEIGTLAYMAPERLDGIAAPSNDIYSLGVILHQMLTGFLPAEEALVSGSLPLSLQAVVQRCMAAYPGDRYSSVTELLHAFEQACQALHAPAASPVSQSAALLSPEFMPTQPIHTGNALGETGDIPEPQPEKSATFGEADYAAPTIAIAHIRMDADASVLKQQNSAVAARDLFVSAPAGKKLTPRRHSRKKPLLVVIPLLIIVVMFVMVGLIYLALPLTASASVTISPQVHVLQQVYSITARPSQTGIDVATASIPIYEKVNTLTGSLTEQTTSQQCNRFFFQCRQVVTFSDVENLSSQLRQTRITQLSAQMDSQLQAIHATAIGTKQFTDISEASNPAIGTASTTVTVMLTEQGSIQYINSADVQQLVRQLLPQKMGPDTILLNSTVQISQPVVEGITDPGTVTMKVAAAGVEEYQCSPAQLQAIANHITGATLADARTYLQQQPGVDANSVSISIHTLFGDGNTLPYSASQIKIISINPTSLPPAQLPALPTPAVTPGGLTPNA